jgi:hypothetical protein
VFKRDEKTKSDRCLLYAGGLNLSLADRDSVGDAATLVGLRRCVPRASGPQMLHQFFLQHAAGLHMKAAIDGLVRHAPRPGLWIRPPLAKYQNDRPRYTSVAGLSASLVASSPLS